MNTTLQRTRLAALAHRILALDCKRPVAATNQFLVPKANPNHEFAKATFLRSARLVALGNWLHSHDQAALDGLRARLEKLIVEANVTGAGSRAQQQSRMGKLFGLAGKEIKDTFNGMAADAAARFDQLAMALHAGNKAKLKAHHGVEAGGNVEADEVLVLGAPLKEHYGALAQKLLWSFKVVVRQGAAAGETAQETASRLGGSLPASPVNTAPSGQNTVQTRRSQASSAGTGPVAHGGDPVLAEEPTPAQAAAVDKRLNVGVKIFDGTERSLSQIIQSAVTALASATDAVDMEDGEETEKRMGWQWVAVMDAATCDACEFYDGSQWDEEMEPVGDGPEYPGDPGLHPNCRCSRIPVDLDEEPAGRSATAQGKPKEMSFDDYLSQFSDSELKQAFGEGPLRNYRRGDITAAALAGQKEHLLTLEGFKKAEVGE